MVKVIHLGKKTALLFFLVMLLAGCAGNAYKKVFINGSNNLGVRDFNAPPDISYAATKRAVLNQNFRIEEEDVQARSFTAARYFEDGKDSIVVTINANVMPSGRDKSTVYISATQHVDKVRVKVDRTLLGLLPIGSEATKVKQEKRTIEDRDFYERVFAAIEKELTAVK
jgi:hypothetical protein